MSFTDRALELHHSSFLFDGLVTGPPSPSIVERLLEAGYNAANWTVAGRNDSTEGAMQKIVTFYWLRDHMPDKVYIVESADDFDHPANQGKLGICIGFQGAEPIGRKFHFLTVFHKLGVRIIQFTYNEGNEWGAGCLEPNDQGLTHLGIQAVRDMNRLGLLIDLTHVGEKSSLDAIAVSDMPVVFSHSSAKAVRDNPRNLSDAQLKAVAAKGGVAGMATFADFVGDTTQGQPTVDQFVDHIAYAADLIGIDHVGIGTDIMETVGPAGVWWNNNTKRRYPEICGAMDEHMHGISGFERWDDFPNATEALLSRGFSQDDVRKVIGGNFKRVLSEVMSVS
jgi:membrane dipeptidase